MLSKRSAMFATGAAVLVALSGSRMVGAADANWASYANGSRPFDAVAGGRDSDGNPLYYCRANFGTDFQPGKLNSTHTTCDFAYGGTEKHAPSV